MNKITKRLAAIGAAMTMALSMMSMSASAQYVLNKKSSGGLYGTVKYNLYVNEKHYGQGIDYCYLEAKANQVKSGDNYLPIKKINFTSRIHLKSGSDSVSTGSATTVNAVWDSSKVATSAVVNESEQGTVTIKISTDYYGSITKTLTNETGLG